MQRPVPYGLQGELCHTLLAEREDAQSRCRVQVQSTRVERIASTSVDRSLHSRDRATRIARSGHLSIERVSDAGLAVDTVELVLVRF